MTATSRDIVEARVPSQVLKNKACSTHMLFFQTRIHCFTPELAKSIVNGIGIGFLSCIGIGIVKTIFQVLVLVLLRGFPNYWYWYC